MRTVSFLDMLDITVQAAVLLDKVLTNAPDFFEQWICHGYWFLRIDWPYRAYGMVSGRKLKDHSPYS